MLHNLAQLPRYRGLIQSLVARELKARYRGSVLGFFWSFINPLLLLLVYTFVFTYVLENKTAGIQPYALFMFCGILPFAGFLKHAGQIVDQVFLFLIEHQFFLDGTLEGADRQFVHVPAGETLA